MEMFYLGTHEPSWLGRSSVSLCVSDRRLRKRRSLPRALSPWLLDSGGFTEVTQYGKFESTPHEYVVRVRRYAADIGRLQYASIQDYMCEPAALHRTGKTIGHHQLATVESYLTLMGLAPDLPWLPVLQGFSLPDYFNCLDLYARHGVDLTRAHRVGLGSICRRQATGEVTIISQTLSCIGLKLHGFGVKVSGLRHQALSLRSSDSLAWSFDARRRKALPGHTHKNCANCYDFAMSWDSAIRVAYLRG